jgi:drug/metabolite transporter (DMT)-like permease
MTNSSTSRLHSFTTYIIFLTLVIVWGSAYFLMKKALVTYSPLHTALLRISIGAAAMLPMAIRYFSKVSKKDIGLLSISGVLGNGLPALLYMFAMQKVDSNVAGILNGLTPIWVLVIGYLLYKQKLNRNKTIGVCLGFVSICFLFLSKGNVQSFSLPHASLILLATLCYGINVNIISNHLSHISSIHIGALSLIGIGLLYFIALCVGVQGESIFTLPLFTKEMLYIIILGVVGTALSNILFFNLIKRSNANMASMVTYLMPIVSIIIGYFGGETIMWQSIVCFILILISVYLVKFAK